MAELIAMLPCCARPSLPRQVLAGSNGLRPEELDVFLKMGSALDPAAVRRKPRDWLPDAVWLNIVALSVLDAFRDLPESVARSDSAWHTWYDAEAPEALPVPDFETRLSGFERMCVVRAFRADRTLVAATQLIASALGPRFVESVPLSMERAWVESRPNCPVICLLSPGGWWDGAGASVAWSLPHANPSHNPTLCLLPPHQGADPTRLVDELARRKKIKVLAVSMGQGEAEGGG